MKSKESLERIKFAQQTKFKHPRDQAVQLITQTPQGLERGITGYFQERLRQFLISDT